MSNRVPVAAARCAVLVALLLLARGAAAQARGARPDDAALPTVTAQEAALLGEVEDLRAADPAAALERLADRLRADSSAALLFAAGNLYVEQDRLDEAETSYRAALERHPRFRLAAVNLARVFLSRDEPAAATELLTRFLHDGQADADVYLLLGHAFLRQARPVSAETAFRHGLMLRPAHHDTLLGLAHALLEQERAVEATALLRELTRTDPARAESWRLRAGASLQVGQTDRALVEIETARRLGHADADMLLRLGDLYLARGQADDAVAAYEAALADTPANPDPALHAARGLLHLGDADRAASMLERVEHLVLTPAQQRTRLEVRAEAARLRGRPEEARAAWRDLVKEAPAHGPAMMALGDLDREAGAHDDAHLWYERAMRVPGFEAPARIRRAQMDAEQGRYERAIEHLETALVYERRADVERYLDQIRRLAALFAE